MAAQLNILSHVKKERLLNHGHRKKSDRKVERIADACVRSFLELRGFSQGKRAYEVTDWNAYVLRRNNKKLPIVKLCEANDKIKKMLTSDIAHCLERAAFQSGQDNAQNSFKYMDAARQFQEVYVLQILDKW